MNIFKRIWNYLQNSGFYRVLNFISKSAIIGLMITLVLFFIEMIQSNKQEKVTRTQLTETLEGLSGIEQSLSTRFLGIFPGYITNICDLFYNIQEGDSVIVFEDVLYYGIKSRPEVRRSVLAKSTSTLLLLEILPLGASAKRNTVFLPSISPVFVTLT